jgi:hypothetical protein
MARAPFADGPGEDEGATILHGRCPRPRQRTRGGPLKAAGNLIAAVVGLAAGLLALEFGLRIAGFGPHFMAADRLLGWRYIPNAPYKWIAEGGSSGRINPAGWRDAPHGEAKDAGTTRVLMLGDSFVAALQVPLDSTCFRRLERGLNARAAIGRRFEVVAMAQDGNGTAAEYLTWRRHGTRYRPDVVALVFVLNDPADNWKPVALDPTRPFFLEDGDSLRLDLSFADSPGFRKYERFAWFKSNTALWPLAQRALGVLRGRAARERESRVADDADSGGTAALPTTPRADGYYRDWNFDARLPADSIPPFRLTERILARFAAEARREGSRFIVFLAGFAFMEEPRLLAECRADPNFDPEKTIRWLAAVGERHGFEVVPLTPAFREAAATTRRSLWFGRHGRYGHWTAAGHEVAARAMENYLAGPRPHAGAPDSLAAGRR